MQRSIGDLKDLRFSQFDLEKSVLIYTQKKQRRTKEPHSITIPLHPEVTGALAGASHSSGPVFPKLSKKRVGCKTGLSLTFRSIIDAAGITYDSYLPNGPRGRRVYSLGFHSLRRSFNTLLANARVSQEVRQKLIGHASAEVNDIYTELETETLRDAIHRLPKLEN